MNLSPKDRVPLSQQTNSFQQIPFDMKIIELGVETKGRLSWMDQAILFVEYMQLISQIIFLNSTFTHSKNPGLLYNSVLYILKIFNPCSLIPTETRNLLLISLFIVIVCFLTVKILLISYITFIAYTGREGHRWLLAFWKWLLKIDGRCCSFFIASFCFNVIQAYNEGNPHVNSLSYSLIIGLTVLVNVLQNGSVILVWARYSYILPSKQLLSAKNQTIEFITLVQKVLLLILQVTLKASPTASVWIVAIINLAFDLLRSGYFLRNIPPYRMLTIKLMAVILMIVGSLNFAYLIVAITNSKQYSPNNMPYALIIWLLFAPIIVKMFWAWTENLGKKILSKFSADDSLPILIQKIEAIRQIRQDSRTMNKFNQTTQFEHFMQSSIGVNTPEIFGIESSTEENILENRSCANKVFTKYLEKIHGMYPKNKLIRLYLAFYYGKKLKLYGVAVKLLAGLEKVNSFSIKFNALLLKLEIQQKISNEYKNNENKLNLMEYHHYNGEYLKLKARILQQAAMQIELCKETGEISANLGKILNLGQVIENQRKFIQKRMNILQEEIPQYFYEPSLVFAYYEFALNHSSKDFAKFSQKALTNHKKYEVRFRSKKLRQENLYENNKMLFKLDIQKETVGIIEECTKSVKPFLGWEAEFLRGNSMLNVLAPSLQAYYSFGINRYKETGDRKILDNLNRTFAYHKNKYLVQVESYLNIHPSLKQGVYLDMIMRPVIDEKEYIFVDKDGVINSFTERIGKKLNLFQNQGAEVRLLSGDLDDMNMIYERVFSLDLPKNAKLADSEYATLEETETQQQISFLEQNQSPKQRARRSVLRYLNLRNKQNAEMFDLYKFYCQEGKKVILSAIGSPEEFCYKCKLDNQYYENFQLKLFVFEEVLGDNGKMKEFGEQGKSGEKNSSESSDEKNTEEETSGAGQTKVVFQTLTQTKEDYPMITSPKETEHPLLTSPKESMPDILFSPKCFSTDALPLVHAPSQADDGDFIEDLVHEKQELEHNIDGYISSLQLQDKKESYPISHDKKREIIKRLKTDNQMKFLIAAEESVGSQRTRNSGQERIMRPVKEALNVRFRPKIYLGYIAIFYVLLIVVFMNQFATQLMYQTNLVSVEARKEVLRNSELRNNMIVKIQRNLRYIWDFSEGRLGMTGLSSSALPLPARVRITKSDLGILSGLNEELMKNTDILTEEDRQKLFERNVEVYYVDSMSTTDSSIKLTGFQAIESVVEAGLKSITLFNLNKTVQAFDVFNFIFRNALNDFFIKSEETSEIFLTSSENDRQDTINLFSVSLIITLVLLGFLTVSSVTLILLQYHREKNLMKSFVKMDPVGLIQVLKRLEDFTKIIQEDVTMDILEKIKPFEFSRGNMMNKGFQNTSKLNKEKDFKKPNHQQILTRYLMHIPLFLVPVLIIGGLITWGSLYYRKEMEYYQDTLNKIYYVDKIKLNLNLAATICGELLSQNDTTFLRNKPLSSQLVNQIEVFDNIISNTMTVLENDQGEYSPLIQTILFEDNCHLFNASFKAICQNAGAGWGTITFLNIIKNMQLTMEVIDEGFTTSDRSQSVLNSLQILGFNRILIPNVITGELCSMIDNQLNLEFDEKIQVMKKRNKDFMVVVWVLLIVFGAIFWDLTFKKILDADLKFKRVLKVMPPRLVLGNFLLKAYLLNTSHGVLNSIRNDL